MRLQIYLQIQGKNYDLYSQDINKPCSDLLSVSLNLLCAFPISLLYSAYPKNVNYPFFYSLFLLKNNTLKKFVLSLVYKPL